MARQPRTKKPDAEPFNGADPAKFDHDGDGSPGGSLPKTGVSPTELAAIAAEAYEAYDYQAERVRFDTLGRRWAFYGDLITPGHSVLRLEVKRLDVVHTDTISTAVLASELGRDMCADVVEKLAEALG